MFLESIFMMDRNFLSILVKKSREWPLLTWTNLVGALLGICIILVGWMMLFSAAELIPSGEATVLAITAMVMIYLFTSIMFVNAIRVVLKGHEREYRIRLTLGARKSSLFFKMVAETMLIAMALVVLAMTMTEMVLSYSPWKALNSLSISSLSFQDQLILGLGLTTIIGLLSTAAPIIRNLRKLKPGSQRIN